MVAIVGGSLQGEQRVERNAGNALLPQLASVVEVEGREAAEVVIHHADVDALSQLLLKKLDDGVPHVTRLDDEVLDEDGALGSTQVCQHVGKHVVAKRVIANVLGLAEGVSGLPLQPTEGLPHALLAVEGGFAEGQRPGVVALADAIEPATERPGGALVSEAEVEQRSHQGNRQDDKQPEQLVGALVALNDNK